MVEVTFQIVDARGVSPWNATVGGSDGVPTGGALYEAALSTYDLSLAHLVASHAQMDPGEYVPDLTALEAMPERMMMAEIDRRSGRYAAAITHLLAGGALVRRCKLDPNLKAPGCKGST